MKVQYAVSPWFSVCSQFCLLSDKLFLFFLSSSVSLSHLAPPTLSLSRASSQTQRSPHVFYRHDLINQLQHNHSLVTLVAENLSAYMETMRQFCKGMLHNSVFFFSFLKWNNLLIVALSLMWGWFLIFFFFFSFVNRRTSWVWPADGQTRKSLQPCAGSAGTTKLLKVRQNHPLDTL